MDNDQVEEVIRIVKDTAKRLNNDYDRSSDIVGKALIKLLNGKEYWIGLEEINKTNYIKRVVYTIHLDHFKKEEGNIEYYRISNRIKTILKRSGFKTKDTIIKFTVSHWYSDKSDFENTINHVKKEKQLNKIMSDWAKQTNFKLMNENMNKDRRLTYISNDHLLELTNFIKNKIKFTITINDMYNALSTLIPIPRTKHKEIESYTGQKSNNGEDTKKIEDEATGLMDKNDNSLTEQPSIGIIDGELIENELIENEVIEFIRSRLNMKDLNAFYYIFVLELSSSQIEKKYNLKSSTLSDHRKKVIDKIRKYSENINILLQNEQKKFFKILCRKVDELFSIKDMEEENE